MRLTAGVTLSLCLLAAPLSAGSFSNPASRFAPARTGTLSFERLPDDPGRTARIQGQMRRVHSNSCESSRIAPNVVLLNGSSFSFLIPAAGSLPGGRGTFFRSDVTLVNYGEEHQDVLIIWLERDKDGTNAPAFRTTLDAGEPPITTQDFIAELGLSGLGALLVTAVDNNDNVVETASIDGFSRIWTNQPNAQGTVSQPFPPVNPGYLVDEFEAISLGLRHDANFRTNAGVTNLDTQAHTFNVYVFGEQEFREFSITVPALSMQQAPIPLVEYGAVTLIFEPADVDDEVDFGWAAYGSSTDNITGDGWVSIAGVVVE